MSFIEQYLVQLGIWGSAESSLSRDWGGAPAEIKFDAFESLKKIWHLVAPIFRFPWLFQKKIFFPDLSLTTQIPWLFSSFPWPVETLQGQKLDPQGQGLKTCPQGHLGQRQQHCPAARTWMTSFRSSSMVLCVSSCSWRTSAFMGTLILTRSFLLSNTQTHGVNYVLNELLYAGPVSTWMGDCPRAGKPSRYEASQLGPLSLLPSVGW